jgi:hypothetical protein
MRNMIRTALILGSLTSSALVFADAPKADKTADKAPAKDAKATDTKDAKAPAKDAKATPAKKDAKAAPAAPATK